MQNRRADDAREYEWRHARPISRKVERTIRPGVEEPRHEHASRRTNRSNMASASGARPRVRVVGANRTGTRSSSEKCGASNLHPGRFFFCTYHTYLEIWVHGYLAAGPDCPRPIAY